MYFGAIINNPNKTGGPKAPKQFIWGCMGDTPEKAGSQALQVLRTSYSSCTTYEVYVGEFTMKACDPQPIVNLVPVKGE